MIFVCIVYHNITHCTISERSTQQRKYHQPQNYCVFPILVQAINSSDTLVISSNIAKNIGNGPFTDDLPINNESVTQLQQLCQLAYLRVVCYCPNNISNQKYMPLRQPRHANFPKSSWVKRCQVTHLGEWLGWKGIDHRPFGCNRFFPGTPKHIQERPNHT